MTLAERDRTLVMLNQPMDVEDEGLWEVWGRFEEREAIFVTYERERIWWWNAGWVEVTELPLYGVIMEDDGVLIYEEPSIGLIPRAYTVQWVMDPTWYHLSGCQVEQGYFRWRQHSTVLGTYPIEFVLGKRYWRCDVIRYDDLEDNDDLG